MRRSILSITLGVMFVAGMAFAIGIPKQMSYQGILAGPTGTPLEDSTVTVEFKIYNVPAGGNSVWAETLSVTTDNQGRLNVTLGLINPIEDTVFRQPERYLSLNVESDGELPRIKLVSMGYSNRVSTIDGSKGGYVFGGTVIVGSGPDDVMVLDMGDPNVALELRSGTFGGNPFIDFVNDAAEDNDARIQLNGEKGLEITVDSSMTIPFGKVGMGTSSPSAKLHVLGAVGDEVARFQAPPETASPYLSLWYNTFEGARIQTVNDVSDGGSLRFFTAAPPFGSVFEQMRISSGGNVGIGTESPSERLHVAGNVQVDDTLFASNMSSLSPLQLQTAGTTRMYVDDVTGNVGVGTTTPTSKLDVAGTVKIGTGGTPIGRVLRSTASLNFPGTGAGAESDLTMTVTGAVVGDAVFLGVPTSSVVSGGAFTAWVSAPSTVTIRFFCYLNAAGADPAIGTFQAVVMQF